MEDLIDRFIKQYSKDLIMGKASIDELKKHLAIVSYAKNHFLLHENQKHDFAYFIIEGAVRSYYLKDGVEVNTWFAFENDMVGSLHTYRNLPSRETFELVENSSFIAINLRTLKPVTHSDIHLHFFIASIIEEYAIFLEDRLFSSQFMSSMERYVNLIEKEPKVLQRIPLTFIASYLGISRETLSRLRAK